jgi:rod shape-determining protein MreB
VSSQEIRDAMLPPLAQIGVGIREVLERTPPELSGDLVDSGLTLCGGGALLPGLDRLIEQETGLRVTIAADPLTCVAQGSASAARRAAVVVAPGTRSVRIRPGERVTTTGP